MSTYKHIFFDLDHTLWDYERNATEALSEMYDTEHLANWGVPSAGAFVEAFSVANDTVWALYDRSLISQAELRHRRFRLVFEQFGQTDFSICDYLNDEFLRVSPQKPHLMAGARETLEYLYPKYPMHLITNGFDEIQGQKLSASGITHYFQEMFTSQRTNARKPQPEIFEYALKTLKIEPSEAIMIGDNPETDMKGAIGVGIDTVFFNTLNVENSYEVKYKIQGLGELRGIL